MKKGLLAAFICLFIEFGYTQSRTLLYTSNSWIQLNVPSGQTPDNRPPTYIDDVIFRRTSFVDSTYNFLIPAGKAIRIGGDTSSFCKRIYVSGMEINFMPDDGENDEGAPVEVYANSGGLISLDSGAVLREGKVHVFGDGGGLGGLQVRNSKFGVYERHNSAWANIYLEDNGKARFINSSFTGYEFETVQKSTGAYATGTGLYAERSTFAVYSFILGDNSVDTFLNSKIVQADNIIGLDFLIGKNSRFISENDTITLPMPCSLNFTTSGSVFKGNIEAWDINFKQEDTAHPLPNIIDGDVTIFESPALGITGQLQISGNLKNFMPYYGYDDVYKANVIVNGQQIFETGGILNFHNSLSISDCAEGYCHFTLEFFGDKNSDIDWNIGFSADTLVINKTGCAKVSSKNPLFVAGETRIKNGQLVLDPIDSIPYKLVSNGNINTSPGGGLFLRRNAKGNVANIAIDGTLTDNNTGTPDSTCAGLSNPYNGRIDYFDYQPPEMPTDSLINFSGSYSDNIVTLYWSVKKQVNIKSFSIEKSFDNSEFLPASNVTATVNDPDQNNYSSTDNSTLKEINYYRLKIFDNHDNYHYSNTIVVSGPEETVIHTDTLADFYGSYSDKSVLLKWLIKNQVNIQSFSIEKSFDNSKFSTISNVAATANDPQENKYSWTDNSTIKEMNYYRLKIFDKQGNYHYSDTIVVSGPEETEIRLYPNPAKDVIHLSLPDAGINTEIKVVDMKGMVIKKIKIDAGTADVPIYISQLQRGAYTIFISTGQTKKTLRFIKE